MSKNEIIWSQCLDCKRDTRHEVLASKTIAGPIYDYRFSDEYRILQCLGCEQISFLKTFHDLEAVYPNDFDDGYSHVEEHTNYYPNASSVISKHASFLPDKLYTIYSETKVALTQKLYIFTAIGIRAIIECICNNKNISGKNLERKITNLGSLGDISRRDVELLHSLRFLGNEAVHELITPEENDINVAFNIIEHLIQSIYIMPKDLKKTKFKIHLDEYQKFENFIIESIKTSPSFDFSYSYSIKKLIGARGKISNENQSKFETILKEKISKDELDWIEITENTEVENINPSETFYRIKKVP